MNNTDLNLLFMFSNASKDNYKIILSENSLNKICNIEILVEKIKRVLFLSKFKDTTAIKISTYAGKF